jgi:PIN like domain
MKFYFDNNLSPRLARAMNELAADEGDTIVHAREKNLQHLPDDEYIRVLSEEGGWVIVTTDLGMSRSPHLVQALASSGLVSVSLRHGWLEMGGMRIAAGLMTRWAKIKEAVVTARPATVVFVPIRGTLQFYNLPRRSRQ